MCVCVCVCVCVSGEILSCQGSCLHEPKWVWGASIVFSTAIFPLNLEREEERETKIGDGVYNDKALPTQAEVNVTYYL